jgi:SlyX protein
MHEPPRETRPLKITDSAGIVKERSRAYTLGMEASKNIDDRVVRIETKIAYLEDFMNKLQAIAVEHTDEIDRLKAENRAFRDKILELRNSVEDIPNARPPHY